jgi:hypothetical protein
LVFARAVCLPNVTALLRLEYFSVIFALFQEETAGLAAKFWSCRFWLRLLKEYAAVRPTFIFQNKKAANDKKKTKNAAM